MHAPHRKHVDHCLNCGAPTPGAYCSACGQEAIDAAVTFRDQMGHFFEEVFSFESRLPQTLKTLFVRPGALTRAYNTGQRVRFVTPLKLYLFASVVFFVVLSFAASRGGEVAHVGSGESQGFGVRFVPLNAPSKTLPADQQTGSPNQWRTADEFDAWLKVPGNEKAMPAFLQPHVRAMLKSPEGFLGSLVDIVSRASMVLVPIHALLLKLVYWRKRLLYGEHIVFSLHLHSFAYFALAAASAFELVTKLEIGLETMMFLVVMGYAVAAARIAYSEGVLRSASKTAIVGFGYSLALAGVLAVTAAGAFFLA